MLSKLDAIYIADLSIIKARNILIRRHLFYWKILAKQQGVAE
jgi:hypothetical protein